MWSASLKDILAAVDMMALVWMGTGHVKNKGRLETVGLRYGMRVGLEGKKACQSMSQRNNEGWLQIMVCVMSPALTN